jgi:hypothetical protein
VIAAGPPAPKMPDFKAGSQPKWPAFNMSSLPKMPKMSLNRGPSTDVTQMKNAIDWVISGKASKYGNIDSSHIATGGLSCGGLQVKNHGFYT